MNLLILSNYYAPEMGAAPNRISNLARGLANLGSQVSVICPLPNYPEGRIFLEYQGRFTSRVEECGITVNRLWIYPSISRNPIFRIFSMLSFASTLWINLFRWRAIIKTDYVIIQNSPLLVSFSGICLFKWVFRRKVALNVSDLWPLSALELGAINAGRFYHVLEWIERFNYRNADCVIGQSSEILDHVLEIVKRPTFLYRNIQPESPMANSSKVVISSRPIRLVYAGLLGVAQGIFDMVRSINFAEIGVEFDIYGHGNEVEIIKSFIEENPEAGVRYRGSLRKQELHVRLSGYHASIVPLRTRIKGAVPSKIFELMHLNVPILFCGSGEGARIVEEHCVGLNSEPGDFDSLKSNIKKLKDMTESEYEALKKNCRRASLTTFNFDNQLLNLEAWLRQNLSNERSCGLGSSN